MHVRVRVESNDCQDLEEYRRTDGEVDWREIVSLLRSPTGTSSLRRVPTGISASESRNALRRIFPCLSDVAKIECPGAECAADFAVEVAFDLDHLNCAAQPLALVRQLTPFDGQVGQCSMRECRIRYFSVHDERSARRLHYGTHCVPSQMPSSQPFPAANTGRRPGSPSLRFPTGFKPNSHRKELRCCWNAWDIGSWPHSTSRASLP